MKVKNPNIIYLGQADTIKGSVEDFLSKWNDLTDSIYTDTSGSTGKPKTIELSKEKMKLSARMTGDFLGLKKGDKALLCLSPKTIGGKMMLVRAIELGLDLYVCEPNSNPLELVDVSLDFIAMVPLQLESSMVHHLDKLNSIKSVIIGGGEISKVQADKLRKNELTVYQTFGMTETISHIAMRKVGLETDQAYTALGENFFEEVDGRLVIHSPLLDESLITNDSVELLDEKHFIWKGRKDFVINSGGIKIHPEEMEKKLESHIDHPFFIGSLQDDRLGERVILCIEGWADEPIEKSEFLKCLSTYEVPKEIYYISQFVRTDSGKINRPETIALINK